MRFLCLQHQRAYYHLSDENLVEQWVSWMHSAGVCYQHDDWHKALSFAGSAYDLAKIRLDKCIEHRADAMAQVTLSAIYLANIFQHLGQLCESRNTLLLAGECLQCFDCTRDADSANELITCLRYDHLRDQLIGRFLNLPYRPFRLPVRANLH